MYLRIEIELSDEPNAKMSSCDQCRQKLKVKIVVECQIYFKLVLVPRVHVQFESKFRPNQRDV